MKVIFIMPKKYFLLALILFRTTSVFATPEEDLVKWVPKQFHPKMEEISEIIKKDPCPPIINSPEVKQVDFGSSFPGINFAQQWALETVCQIAEEKGHRPKVLDVGAGHGFMSRNLVMAGGNVVALEAQKPTAEAAQRTLMQAKICLNTGEKIAEVCKVRLGNALNPKSYVDGPFELTWGGNLLHFFDPEDAKSFASNLFSITTEGGYAVYTVNTPSKSEQSLKIYRERKVNGSKWPGYMVMDKMITEVITMESLKQMRPQDTSVDVLGVHGVEPSSSLKPGQIKFGQFKDSVHPERAQRTVHDVIPNVGMKAKYLCHSVLHFFGPDEARDLFENAGFKVLEIFYFSPSHSKISLSDMTDSLLSSEVFNLGIIAQKPKIAL